jgi:hypothetical protein
MYWLTNQIPVYTNSQSYEKDRYIVLSTNNQTTVLTPSFLDSRHKGLMTSDKSWLTSDGWASKSLQWHWLWHSQALKLDLLGFEAGWEPELTRAGVNWIVSMRLRCMVLLVNGKSGSVRSMAFFCGRRTGPRVRSREVAELWTGPTSGPKTVQFASSQRPNVNRTSMIFFHRNLLFLYIMHSKVCTRQPTLQRQYHLPRHH